MNWLRKLSLRGGLLLLGVAMLGVTLCPLAAPAATHEIKITVTDPDKSGKVNYTGTTVNSALAVPMVSNGENKILGTLRITGKEGNSSPVAVGNKVQVILPVGLAYMQTPNAENYQHYVTWPAELDGVKNKLYDTANQPAMRFIAATPRSLTLAVSNVNNDNKMLALDFNFDQKNYSAVRVSKLFTWAPEYLAQPQEKITRMEFFQKFADITIPFTSSRPDLKTSDVSLEKEFKDVTEANKNELEIIKPLFDSGFIKGDNQGRLNPDKNITRAEAVSLIGQFLPQTSQKSFFKDALPFWAAENINRAAALGIVAGYPDKTFRAKEALSKGEALVILQKTLESYSH